MKRSLLLYSVVVSLVVMCTQKTYSLDLVLKVGVAKTDITPTESLYMGGYDSNMRDVPSDGAYGKIYTRAVVFDDMGKKIVFIVSDIVGYRGYDSIRKSCPEWHHILYHQSSFLSH